MANQNTIRLKELKNIRESLARELDSIHNIFGIENTPKLLLSRLSAVDDEIEACERVCAVYAGCELLAKQLPEELKFVNTGYHFNVTGPIEGEYCAFDSGKLPDDPTNRKLGFVFTVNTNPTTHRIEVYLTGTFKLGGKDLVLFAYIWPDNKECKVFPPADGIAKDIATYMSYARVAEIQWMAKSIRAWLEKNDYRIVEATK